MDRRIIYTRPDGGMDIVIPCRCTEDGHLTDDQIFQRAIRALPDNAVNIRVIAVDDVPIDRTFRNAWGHSDGQILVNMVKARDLWMDKIRQVRNAKLVQMDIETIKAIGAKDDELLAAIEAKKQVLRDLPQTISLDKAETPEELKATWPAELD